MISIWALIILLCSSLALCICLRELANEVLRHFTARNSENLVRSVTREMRTMDYKMTGGAVSEEWINRVLESRAQSRENSKRSLSRMDYVAWLIGLSIVASGGLIAGFSYL